MLSPKESIFLVTLFCLCSSNPTHLKELDHLVLSIVWTRVISSWNCIKVWMTKSNLTPKLYTGMFRCVNLYA